MQINIFPFVVFFLVFFLVFFQQSVSADTIEKTCQTYQKEYSIPIEREKINSFNLSKKKQEESLEDYKKKIEDESKKAQQSLRDKIVSIYCKGILAGWNILKSEKYKNSVWQYYYAYFGNFYLQKLKKLYNASSSIYEKKFSEVINIDPIYRWSLTLNAEQDVIFRSIENEGDKYYITEAFKLNPNDDYKLSQSYAIRELDVRKSVDRPLLTMIPSPRPPNIFSKKFTDVEIMQYINWNSKEYEKFGICFSYSTSTSDSYCAFLNSNEYKSTPYLFDWIYSQILDENQRSIVQKLAKNQYQQAVNKWAYSKLNEELHLTENLLAQWQKEILLTEIKKKNAKNDERHQCKWFEWLWC